MPRRRKKKPTPAGPKIDKRRSKVTEAEIVAELARNGGKIVAAARTLNIRAARVTSVSIKHGHLAELKKRESTYAAVEQAVLSLAAVMETMRRGDGEDAKAMSIALAVSVDKLLLIDGKPNMIHSTHATSQTHTVTQAESVVTQKTIDLADILGALGREGVEKLLDLKDKANGVEPPDELSDLDNPEVYDDATYQPPPQPELNG